jgi:hypothetical protein
MDSNLKNILEVLDDPGGWPIAAIHVRALAEKCDTLSAENAQLRETCALAAQVLDARQAQIDTLMLESERTP